MSGDCVSASTTPVARKAAKDQCPERSSGEVTVETYRGDPMYPKIVRAVESILKGGKVVAPVDVLVEMGLLDRRHLEDWRRGRVSYLERVIDCDLTRLSRLLRILRFHTHDLNLTPSWTAYMRWGKGPKQRLRFTKSGEQKLEELYATHFVWPGKGPFHPPAAEETTGRPPGR
jgi:hypothetical protein